MPFLSPTRTLFGSPRAPPFPTDLGCVLHRWHHVNVLLRWTTAATPESQYVDSRCSSYCHPGCDRLVNGIAANFCFFVETRLKLVDGLPFKVNEPIYPHEQVAPDYMFTSSRTNLEKINPDLTSLNKLIMCLAIEIHSKLTFLVIMNKKTIVLFDESS